MNARQALVNFHNHMVKVYGTGQYREVWTEDDAQTSEILERQAAKFATVRLCRIKDDTPFLRRMRGSLTGNVEADQREKEWAEWVEKYGTGVVGKLSPAQNIYEGAFVESSPAKVNGTSYAVANGSRGMGDPESAIDAEDVDSSNIMAYLLGK